MKPFAVLFLAVFSCAAAEPGWWLKEPIRWVQTNLRETDANLDANRLINQLTEMQANVLLIGMGGITAYYPTKVEFHYPSPYMPAGRDMFGDVLALAHKRGIRVVGRFDLSKTPRAVFDAHPEWFFRKSDGSPVIYNGLYSTCINGGFYREQAMKILGEALDKYDVDGLFFNMFGNQSRDYSGNEVGLCHCDVCRRKYHAMFHKEIPEKADSDYRRFMFISSREIGEAIGKLIHEKRPAAGYFNYLQEYTDGIMSESNTAVKRPLPLWPYSASDNVNRALNSQPGKLPVNLCMQFVDYAWRFATVPSPEIATRLWQNVANGGALAFEVNGTLDQQDRQALDIAKPIFRWLHDNEQYYAGQTNAARVLLLGHPGNTGRAYNEQSYRGMFRLLTEEHIPFAVADNLDWLNKRQFDLVVATDWAPKELASYINDGGHVLIASAAPPDFPVSDIAQKWADAKGYFRVRDHTLLKSLSDTEIMMLDGPYTETKEDPSAPLTFIPPSMFGPPEKVHVDWKDTTKPGLILRSIGKGKVAWIPWNLGDLYYHESLTAHAGLFRDVVDALCAQRQLQTNAHPLVEMTLMHQADHTLLHLINLSGHSQTGYFSPIPTGEIQVEVAGNFRSAQALRGAATLSVQLQNGFTKFVVPNLKDYELVVLQ